MAVDIESLIKMLPTSFDASKAKGVDTIIQLNVSGIKGGKWNVTIKNGKLSVATGAHLAPEITLAADGADLLALANGELDPAKAFLMGKIKVTGDMTEAMNLLQLFRPN